MSDPAAEQTVWPPADWFLEVRGGAFGDRGYEARQCFQAWSDGFALYREAGSALWPPAWDRVSAWKMDDDSTRLLARLVHRAGLDEMPEHLGENPESPGPTVSIYVRAFGREKRTTARGRTFGGFVRALHVINAFVPAGEGFTLPDMTGDREPPHLARVPELDPSAERSLALHETLLSREPGGAGFVIDTLALALACGKPERARELLRRVEELERTEASTQMRLPGYERASLSEALRARIDARK